MNLDRRLIQQAVAARAPLIGAVLAGLLLGIATIWQARLLAAIVAGVFLDGQTLVEVMPALTLFLAALLARVVLSYLGEMAAVLAAAHVKQRLREALARHLLASGPAFTMGERSGELVNTVTQGIEALDAYFSQYLPQLALAGLFPLTCLFVIFPLDPLSAVVLLLTGPLIPFFMFLIGSKSQSLTHTQWAALSRMSAYFLDTLQGLTTLKALGRSRAQAGQIAEVSERYRVTTMSVLRVTFLSALVLELLSTLGTAIIAVEIGLRLLYGQMGFEIAFFLLLLAPEFYFPLRQLGLRFHASMAGVSAARRIFAVLEQPVPEPASARTAGRAPVVSLARPFVLAFDQVSYTYPGRAAPALSDVSFSLAFGQKTALVGRSGAGKSSAVQLLLRFMEPSQGRILVNGVPLADLPLDEWRAQIAWVPQYPYLFHGTLADNLRLARPRASLADLRRAAAFAQMEEWIDHLPQGFDTPVGEGGARLSGGQAQRLALARAFLRDAPFLIMDEPTAHLDVAQEALLQEASRRLSQNRTVLVIAHRLPTVLDAAQVIVLDEGRLVEYGAPGDLLSKGGPFARMASIYSGGGANGA